MALSDLLAFLNLFSDQFLTILGDINDDDSSAKSVTILTTALFTKSLGMT